MEFPTELSSCRLFPHRSHCVDKSRANIRNFIKARQFISASVPGIVPSRILTGINRKAKLMCESAASHTTLRRFISVRARCARFAHNSLMRRGLLFKLFNSGEKPLGLGAIYRRRFVRLATLLDAFTRDSA